MGRESAMAKNRKFIIFLLLFSILTIFSAAQAAKDKVDIYLFRGEGCSHCAQLEPYLLYLQDETYKGKIKNHKLLTTKIT